MRLVVIILCAWLALPAAAADLVGVAVVQDGDTIEIGDARIRIWGADAPEGKQTCTRDGVTWLCGQEASKVLRELVSGQVLRCVEKDRDRYGRIVCQCFTPAGADLAAVMVRNGLALAYRQYSREYVGAEDKAKAERLGMWSGQFTPPWEWRRTSAR